MSELERYAHRHGSDVRDLRRWLVESMVLGAVADGELDQRESESIVDAIATRPEFRGMEAAELRSDLEAAWSGLIHDGARVRLHALAGALDRYPHRVLAFRGAVSVAMSNGALTDDEIEFLRDMQNVLGIHEEDVTRAFDEIGGDGNALPERVEPVEAYLDCLLMAGASDGHFELEELSTVIAFVLTRPEFEGIPEEAIRRTIELRLKAFSPAAVARRLDELPAELVTDEERENAYGLALSISMSDDELDDAEIRFLGRLQEALGISAPRAEALRSRVEAGD